MATLIVDTSVLVAYIDGNDGDHAAVADWIDGAAAEWLTTPLVVAESDYLLARAGEQAQYALWGNLASGALEVEWWSPAARLIARIARENPPIGLTDASLVALAARHRTTRIATLDQRHFRRLKPATGESAFTLLPADAT